MYDLPGTGTFLLLMVIAAIVGWAAIEGVISLFSFIFG